MNIDEIVDRVFHVQFKSQCTMALTFLRFQEYFESPRFRGKIFTFDEFRRGYIQNSPEGKETGRFTYHEDWEGFNIPSSILLPFYDGAFDPLTAAEKRLLDAFESMKGDRFYIIGTTEGNIFALQHEVAHGLFYTTPAYRREATAALSGFTANDRALINTYLENVGYHEASWLDETHAYTLISIDDIAEAGVSRRRAHRVQKRLKSVFERYCGVGNMR